MKRPFCVFVSVISCSYYRSKWDLIHSRCVCVCVHLLSSSFPPVESRSGFSSFSKNELQLTRQAITAQRPKESLNLNWHARQEDITKTSPSMNVTFSILNYKGVNDTRGLHFDFSTISSSFTRPCNGLNFFKMQTQVKSCTCVSTGHSGS